MPWSASRLPPRSAAATDLAPGAPVDAERRQPRARRAAPAHRGRRWRRRSWPGPASRSSRRSTSTGRSSRAAPARVSVVQRGPVDLRREHGASPGPRLLGQRGVVEHARRVDHCRAAAAVVVAIASNSAATSPVADVAPDGGDVAPAASSAAISRLPLAEGSRRPIRRGDARRAGQLAGDEQAEPAQAAGDQVVAVG